MATSTLKITGLSEETLRIIDEQARKRVRARNGYPRGLIKHAVTANNSGETPALFELYASVQEECGKSKMTETDIDALIDEARNPVSRNCEMTRTR